MSTNPNAPAQPGPQNAPAPPAAQEQPPFGAPASADAPPAAPAAPDPGQPPPPSEDPGGTPEGFPTPGQAWDPTEQPPPDAAVGASGPGWQEPTPPAENPPAPQTAAPSAAAVAQEQDPDATISPSTFDVVAGDGSTAKTTPDYSTVPCPACANTTVRTTNVQAATPAITLRGETVNPGDQVVVCDSCGATIAAGDAGRFEQDAGRGAYGDRTQAAVSDQAATLELEDERRQIDTERDALQARLEQLDQREQRLEEEQSRTVDEQGAPRPAVDETAPELPTREPGTTTEGGDGGNG